MQTVAALLMGALVGLLIGRRLPRKQSTQPVADPVPPGLPEEAYVSERQALIERYERSMAQFDRLIPWGAGGTIVVSATGLAQLPPSDLASTLALGIGWLLLLIALSSSTWSHFTSSRLFSARRAMLDLAQNGESSGSGYAGHQDVHSRASRATYWLNWIAALTFPSGILGVALYAFPTAIS